MPSQPWLWVLVLLAIPTQVDAQRFRTSSERTVSDTRYARPIDALSQAETTRGRSPGSATAIRNRNKSARQRDECVLVVIQAGLGVRSSEAVRESLAKRFSLRVVTMRDITTRDERPHVLLTLARDRRGSLSASLWLPNGRVEVFSAQAPRQPEALLVAAVTLATSVVDRFIREVNNSSICEDDDRDDDAALAALERVFGARTLYRALRRLGMVQLRTGELLIEDFF